MMDAYISGQAARAVFDDGIRTFFIDAFSPDEENELPRTEIKRVFGGATDVERRQVKNKNEIFDLLLTKYNFDRGLALIDIFLRDKRGNLKAEFLESLNEILSHPQSREKIENTVYAMPNSNLSIAHCERLEGVSKDFFSSLCEHQDEIFEIDRLLWQALKHNQVGRSDATRFWSRTVESGVFRNLVQAKKHSELLATAIFKAYSDLSDLPNHRSTLSDWTKNFTSKHDRKSLKPQSEEDDWGDKNNKAVGRVPAVSSHEAFSAVLKQKQAILDKLKLGNLSDARKFAEQLIVSQLETKQPDLAAKSMSSLAVQARRMGVQQLELEWAERAVELAPEDGYAHGVLADTYLDLRRLDEAKRSFEEAGRFGERQFAALGMARLLLVSGQIAMAEEQFSDLVKRIGDDRDHGEFAWHGYINSLAESWQLDNAKVACETGLKKHPQSELLRIDFALIASQLGEFSDAVTEFKSLCEVEFPSAYAFSGLGSVYGKLGRVDDALEVLNRGIEKFENNVDLRIERAIALKLSGKFNKAIEELEALEDYSHGYPRVGCVLAEVYREKGDLQTSLEIYNETVSRFGINTVARSGRANILKLMGRFEEALKSYDQNVRDFPFDLVALNGRADMLRLLGYFKDGLDAYDKTIQKFPKYPRAKVSKAAVHIAIGDLANAMDLLPHGEPQTETDWVAYHLKGMIKLKSGDFEVAKDIFSNGMMACPFAKQRSYFSTALALVSVRQGDLQEACKVDGVEKNPIGLIVKSRVVLELGDFSEAEKLLDAVNDNEPAPVQLLLKNVRSQLMSKDTGARDPLGEFCDSALNLLAMAA